MKVAGKVCIGFSDPYVAKYNNAGGVITYTEGMKLARGVSVSVTPEISEGNNFFADNIAAETEEGYFTKGTVSLTVDGLHQEAERYIFGLSATGEATYGEVKAQVTKFGAEPKAPYVGIGYLAKYKSGGIVSYTPTILCKGKFVDNGEEHQTAEETTNYQTQNLKANLVPDDSAERNWKMKLGDYATQEEALTVLKAALSVPGTGA